MLFPSRTVAFSLFGFSVHWYGLLYLAGFLLAFFLLPRLQHHRQLPLSRDDWASLLAWAVVGVIVGGRLGYVLFYEPQMIFEDPAEILRVWHGGMASHGGFLGVTFALWFALRRKQLPILAIADVAVVPVAIGLALGRLGNFINQELYGTVTTVPWALAIPGVEGLRHPTQLYAIAKDLFIAAACYWHLMKMQQVRPGSTTALFLMLYAILRFLVEFLRDQPYPLTDLGILSLTRGQLLTLPVLLAGFFLWRYCSRRDLR